MLFSLFLSLSLCLPPSVASLLARRMSRRDFSLPFVNIIVAYVHDGIRFDEMDLGSARVLTVFVVVLVRIWKVIGIFLDVFEE